jgi:hypothetical protein
MSAPLCMRQGSSHGLRFIPEGWGWFIQTSCFCSQRADVCWQPEGLRASHYRNNCGPLIMLSSPRSLVPLAHVFGHRRWQLGWATIPADGHVLHAACAAADPGQGGSLMTCGGDLWASRVVYSRPQQQDVVGVCTTWSNGVAAAACFRSKQKSTCCRMSHPSPQAPRISSLTPVQSMDQGTDMCCRGKRVCTRREYV